MLSLTPKEVMERKALTVNPAKTCQPIGAMYAAMGIHRCLPHSHGSQGCCAYHRSHLTRHYKEPVMATSSSFTEGAAVFGGISNLRQAITNIFHIYNPDVIAVHTTCLSETIGDDLPSIIQKVQDEGLIPDGKWVIHTNTPSYAGSHVTGFSHMTTSMVRYFAQKDKETREQLNVIPGYVEPADMREIRRILAEMNIPAVVFPDTSDVLDAPQIGKAVMYPKGGVKIEALKSTGTSTATLALGTFASLEPALELESKFDIPARITDLPIGIAATDRFLQALLDLYELSEPPDSISDDRGRMVDIMTDMQQYFFDRKVAIYGDPDQVISLTELAVSLGMKPIYVLTGTPGKRFEMRIKGILRDVVPGARIKSAGDLFLLHQWIKNEPVDLLIGNTYGKYIARAEDIPFVRYGFPILDRIGHSYFPTVGYKGGLRLLEKILDALLDRQDRDSPEERFELVL